MGSVYLCAMQAGSRLRQSKEFLVMPFVDPIHWLITSPYTMVNLLPTSLELFDENNSSAPILMVFYGGPSLCFLHILFLLVFSFVNWRKTRRAFDLFFALPFDLPSTMHPKKRGFRVLRFLFGPYRDQAESRSIKLQCSITLFRHTLVRKHPSVFDSSLCDIAC